MTDFTVKLAGLKIAVSANFETTERFCKKYITVDSDTDFAVSATREEIAAAVNKLGEQITADYQGKDLLLVGILKGSVVFFTDLMRAMKTPVTIEFMKVSSYGFGTVSSGKLSVSLNILSNIEGKDVLIVEDIIDSGNTMYALKKMLATRNPASLRIITLLDKPSRRVAEVSAEYTCFEIEDEFVIGYGLDYAEKYRDLPYVGVLSRSVYEQ